MKFVGSAVLLLVVGSTTFLQCSGHGMFRSRTSELLGDIATTQLNYGVAVSDVDGDGDMEWIVAGFNGPNIVLKYDHIQGKYVNLAQNGSIFESLRDESGAAIGVCACDVDGDGREEIYFLNTNDRYAGDKQYKDKLFKFTNGRYEDVFSDPINDRISHMFAGRSVACVDRRGTGKYGVLLASYARYGSGEFGLIEMDEQDAANDVVQGVIVLKNVGAEAGINLSTGGRGIAVGPILSSDRSDILFVNEGNPGIGNMGDNALFKNRGDGTFDNMAAATGIADAYENGRGVALADFNNDGLVDITYGNWVGPHRLYLQRRVGDSSTFEDVASPDFKVRSPIRTVIAADFDNDRHLEVFLNNIVYTPSWGASYNMPVNNSLFKVLPYGEGVDIQRMDIGDALEPDGYGTGAGVADLDNDGFLELLISHGESQGQPLEVYSVREGQRNRWIRIMPLTESGAPARGAAVTLTMSDNTRMLRIIDGGSGYLCQMEPVAHFGLGQGSVKEVKVQWPGGQTVTKTLPRGSENTMFKIGFYGQLDAVEHHSSESQHSGPHVDGNGAGTSRGNRPGTSRDSCQIEEFRGYVTDPVTGCRSRHAVRQARCNGVCSRRRRPNCCQAMHTRNRNISFRCGGDRRRIRRMVTLGPRRCRCRRCST